MRPDDQGEPPLGGGPRPVAHYLGIFAVVVVIAVVVIALR